MGESGSRPSSHDLADDQSPGKEVPPEESPTPDGFPIVGVGASAGGLEAFAELLKALLADTGMAFVLVMHLDPHHKSVLADVVSHLGMKYSLRRISGLPALARPWDWLRRGSCRCYQRQRRAPRAKEETVP